MNKRQSPTLSWSYLGRASYSETWTLQEEYRAKVLAGNDEEQLFLVEHPPTISLGRAEKGINLLYDRDLLKNQGFDVVETNRGGKLTYHGLGQIVGYPIINLSPDREDVHRYVRDLEEVLIRTMNDFDIEAFRIEGLTGVHTSRGKVAAIGVHIARWVTTHGFALNVNTDLGYFDLIVACDGEPVTSMKDLLAQEIELSLVEDRIIERFAEVFEMEPESVPAAVAAG